MSHLTAKIEPAFTALGTEVVVHDNGDQRGRGADAVRRSAAPATDPQQGTRRKTIIGKDSNELVQGHDK